MPSRQASETTATAVHDSAEDDLAQLDGGELRCVERLLASLGDPSPDPFTFPRRELPPTGESTNGALQTWALQPLPDTAASEAKNGFLAWMFLGLGLMAFACGGVMLGWAVAAQREELWSLGIPLTLGGQAALLFGLIGLLEASSHRCQGAIAALDEHRQRLTMMQNLALAGQATPRRRAA